MKIETSTLSFSSRGNTDIIDLTAAVEEVVGKSKIKDGLIQVFVAGSTAGITTIEYESGLVKDLSAAFDRLIPRGIHYAHDATWGDGNGYAHIRASLLGSDRAFPLQDGHLVRGTWQQIVLVDFDNRPRQRQVIVQILGK